MNLKPVYATAINESNCLGLWKEKYSSRDLFFSYENFVCKNYKNIFDKDKILQQNIPMR